MVITAVGAPRQRRLDQGVLDRHGGHPSMPAPTAVAAFGLGVRAGGQQPGQRQHQDKVGSDSSSTTPV